MRVDSMEKFSNSELNDQLSVLKKKLISDNNKENIGNKLLDKQVENVTLNYCGNWDILMPLSLKFGAYVSPLAWERSIKKYRAKHIAMDENGRMATYGINYMSDDNDPARALVMTLIKIFKSKLHKD
jgi:hypothetical protein